MDGEKSTCQGLKHCPTKIQVVSGISAAMWCTTDTHVGHRMVSHRDTSFLKLGSGYRKPRYPAAGLTHTCIQIHTLCGALGTPLNVFLTSEVSSSHYDHQRCILNVLQSHSVALPWTAENARLESQNH